MNDVRIVSIWPRTTICEPFGRSLRAASIIGAMSPATPPRSRPCTEPYVDHWLDVVMRDDGGAGLAPHGRHALEHLRRLVAVAGRHRDRLQVLQRVHPV